MATIYIIPGQPGFTDYYGESWGELNFVHGATPGVETGTAPTIDGVDLAATTFGLHRSYRLGANIYVNNSFDQAHSWGTVQVATDAAPDALPTISSDHRDTLYLWHHDNTGHARCFYSRDAGHSWTSHASIASLKWPVALVALNGQLLAGILGGNLVLYRSVDFWATRPLLLSVAASDQVPALALDRRGFPYLAYESGGSVLRRTVARDLLTVSAPTTLLTGTKPTLAAGLHAATLLFWSGSALESSHTGSDYGALVGSPDARTSGLSVGRVGVAVSRANRTWYTGKTAGGGFRTWFSDRYESGFTEAT